METERGRVAWLRQIQLKRSPYNDEPHGNLAELPE
jgi:hypothetical protein